MNDIHLKKISPMFGTIRIEGTEKENLCFVQVMYVRHLDFQIPGKLLVITLMTMT